MKFEIERKFLVEQNYWQPIGYKSKIYCKQGYIKISEHDTVRVRTVENKGYITIKGQENNLTRLEFEYEIPYDDANQILDKICIKPIIEKIRYFVEYKGKIWHVDEFLGENKGLILAEIELSSEDEQFELPPWIKIEVTKDKRYYNAYLVLHPYKIWQNE